MRFKVHYLKYETYWVAEASNGAVSQGSTLDECQKNIKDAIAELEEYNHDLSNKIIEEFYEDVEVPV